MASKPSWLPLFPSWLALFCPNHRTTSKHVMRTSWNAVSKGAPHTNTESKQTNKTLISVSVFINDTPTVNRWSRSWSLLKRAVAGIAPHHWPGGMHEAIKYPLQGRRMAEGPQISCHVTSFHPFIPLLYWSSTFVVW